ncbi:MAG: MBL fold metallo-hydrolase [Lachnospiraceae bacterium]|nr:MBL fold metallo-hydrolase [Lachnospiraceae bacterium]
MDTLNFYSHEKISDRVYIFTEGYSAVHRFTIGVIVGDEKILVIDTGLGMGGDLRQAIEKVTGTGKPMICASTHCHVDHVGSSVQFDQAYVNLEDYKRFYDFAFGEQQRLDDLKAFAMESREVSEYCANRYVKNRDTVFQDLQDGDVFDLGGARVEVYALPGHSGGSMVFFYRAEKILFSGDDINTDASLKKITREGFHEYAKRLKELEKKIGDDFVMYPGHLHMPMDVQVLRGIAKASEEISQGMTQMDPPGETIFSNRANDSKIRMHMADNCIVIYSQKFTQTQAGEAGLNFLSYEKRGERLYIVTENYSQAHRLTIGVVVGDDRVLVIDAGLGMTQELRRTIESFAGTDKPMVCACTCGEWDHVGSACLFDKVYMNEEDVPMLARSCDWERRLCALDSYCLHNHEVQEYCFNHGIRDNSFTPEYIKEGDRLELGGVSAQVISIPGVTAGQTAYYIPEEKVCFCGDGVNMDVHLEKMNGKELLLYRDVLGGLYDRLPEDVRLYSTHTNRPHPKKTIKSLMGACLEVAEGKTETDPPQESMYVHLYGNRNIRLHYYDSTCVIYDRTKMEEH